MSLHSSILSTLDIKKGEETPIILMVLYSFFMGIAIAFFYTATISMFLENFERKTLPYAYIASGIVGYILWYFYAQFQKKLIYAKLLAGSVWFLLITVALLAIMNVTWGNKWLPFVMYIWIKVFTFLSSVSFWGMASRIFDLRQGKRLFGLIGSGAVISDIIGFFSVPFLLKFIKTPDLLYIAIIGLVLCLFCLAIISRKYTAQLQVRISSPSSQKKGGQSIGEFLQNRYYLLIFILAILPMFGIYFVDFIFLGQVRQEFTNKEVLTGFLGIFFGSMAVIEFIVKTFISGRLLTNYGLKAGLLALPILVGAITLGATIAGILGGTVGLFFSLVALDKLIERTARTSLNDTSFQILYQPLPAEERIAFQSKVEGVPKAIGNVIAGGSLLVFAAFGLTNLLYVCYILLVLLAIWIFVALLMHTEYRRVLTDSVMGDKNSLMHEHLAETAEQKLKTLLESSSESQRLVGLVLLENIEPLTFTVTYQKYLTDSATAIRRYIIRRMAMLSQVDALEKLKQHEEADVQTRQYLQETIKFLTELKTLSSDKITDKTLGSLQERVSIAHYLGNSKPSSMASKLLSELLIQDNLVVQRAAMLALAKHKMRERLPKIIEYTSHVELATAGVSALANFGDMYLILMEATAIKSGYNDVLQQQMAKVYGRVGTKLAQTYLFDRIKSVDYTLQKQVLYALSLSGFQALDDDENTIKNSIEQEVEYLVWATAAIVDLPEEQPEYQYIRVALEDEIQEKRNKIFLWLSLLYEAKAIKNIKKSVENPSGNRAFILEVVDMIVAPELKDLLIPVLDDVSYNERLNALKLQFPQEKLSATERLKDIVMAEVSKVNTWTRACALYAVIETANTALYDLLLANINNVNPIMRQLGIVGLKMTDNKKLESFKSRIALSEQNKLDSVVNHSNGRLSYIDNVLIIKKTDEFGRIPSALLIPLALAAEKVKLRSSESITETDKYSYIVIHGRAKASNVFGIVVELRAHFFMGECSSHNPNAMASTWVAETEMELLRIPNYVIYSLFSSEPECITQLQLSLAERGAKKVITGQALEMSASV